MLMLRHENIGEEARQYAKFSRTAVIYSILEHLDSVVIIGIDTNFTGDA
jgi:hypothetical protein